MTDLSPTLIWACRIARAVCLAFAFLVPPLAAYGWIAGGLFGHPLVAPGDPPMGLGLRLIGGAITMVPTLLMSWALWHLAHVFRLYGGGAVLSHESAASLRRFALALPALALARLVAEAALSVVRSWNAEPGLRQLAVAIDGDMVALAVLGALLSVIATALHRATDIAEEQRMVI